MRALTQAIRRRPITPSQAAVWQTAASSIKWKSSDTGNLQQPILPSQAAVWQTAAPAIKWKSSDTGNLQQSNECQVRLLQGTAAFAAHSNLGAQEAMVDTATQEFCGRHVDTKSGHCEGFCSRKPSFKALKLKINCNTEPAHLCRLPSNPESKLKH
eukprot:1158360-Pelagomonas_calceolata.AAC.4